MGLCEMQVEQSLKRPNFFLAACGGDPTVNRSTNGRLTEVGGYTQLLEPGATLSKYTNTPPPAPAASTAHKNLFTVWRGGRAVGWNGCASTHGRGDLYNFAL
jgi:hypothetical protein